MKKAIISILVLAVLATGVWLVRPAYRAHKEKKFAAQASVALAKREHRQALLSAQQALVLNSNNLVACRVMADLADGSRSPHAMVWRRRIADIQPSLENRIVFASCALRYEQPPFPMTAQVLQEVGGQAQDFVPFHLVSAQLALRQNHIAEAEKHFEQAIRLEPTNDLHRLNLAVMRLESKDAAVSTAARKQLEQLQSSEQWAGHALRALIIHHTARKQFAEAQRYSVLLLRNRAASFGDHLEHLAVLHGGKSPEFNRFLETVQHAAATNAVKATDLVTRMVSLSMAREALAWAKSLPAPMQSELPLPVAVTDAYIKMGDWRGMEELLLKQNWREREFLRFALLAYAVRNQKAKDVATVHWNEAVQLASARPELVGMLTQLASNWGWTNETETLLWRAAKQFPRERWPIDALQNRYARSRSARGLFDVSTLLLERQPTNTVAQNNWATLALLLHTNVPKAHQFARQVYDRNTNHYGFVSTYAFSLHLQGKTAEALKMMETLKPAELENPALASYYGVMLAASGQTDKARRYLAKAEMAPILPEELKLIADARKGM